MSAGTERIIFRIKLEIALSKFEKEDQDNIQKEIDEILKINNDDVLSFETVSLIIYYYFKFEKLKELKKD
jgi:hypothetical protein